MNMVVDDIEHEVVQLAAPSADAAARLQRMKEMKKEISKQTNNQGFKYTLIVRILTYKCIIAYARMKLFQVFRSSLFSMFSLGHNPRIKRYRKEF